MAGKLYSKQELCDLIYGTVVNAKNPPTRLEICRAIGRKKSPHILNMIEQLVTGGWLVETSYQDGKKLPTFRYSVGRLAQPDCSNAA